MMTEAELFKAIEALGNPKTMAFQISFDCDAEPKEKWRVVLVRNSCRLPDAKGYGATLAEALQDAKLVTM